MTSVNVCIRLQFDYFLVCLKLKTMRIMGMKKSSKEMRIESGEILKDFELTSTL